MPETTPDAEEFLAHCEVSPEIFELQPDYRAQVVVIEGLSSISSNAFSDDLIRRAERRAIELLKETSVEDLPHIASWRAAYRAFGAKPQRTRNSLEALTRRAENGLPRINMVADIYNAISVLHQVPAGGEDLDLYSGSASLTRASGDEMFETMVEGKPATENPKCGEVIWRDEAGATCRRWNWRQGRRTALSEETHRAVFIFDALEPMSDAELDIAKGALIDAFKQTSSGVRAFSRRIDQGTSF